jgi:hypothetical protein
MKPTIGADPEFFLYDTAANKYVSAHGLVPGTKEKPFKLKDGACQLDGTAVEFNINPASSSYEFSYNIGSVLAELRGMIPQKYQFKFTPSVMYDPDTWKDIPDNSKELGCNPDYNAVGNEPEKARVPKALPKQYETLRTGAGHIHVGWTSNKEPMEKSHFWDATELTKQLYYVFKKASPIWDNDNLRNKLYGSGAAFRPKPYGTEFRSPSNAWLNYPRLWEWIFDATKATFRSLEDNRPAGYEFGAMWQEATVKDFNLIAENIDFPKIPVDWKEEAHG